MNFIYTHHKTPSLFPVNMNSPPRPSRCFGRDRLSLLIVNMNSPPGPLSASQRGGDLKISLILGYKG